MIHSKAYLLIEREFEEIQKTQPTNVSLAHMNFYCSIFSLKKSTKSDVT